MIYDQNNVFAKILSGEISCNKVYEDSVCCAFHDINPKAKTHVLVIPKRKFTNFTNFAGDADIASTGTFFYKVQYVVTDVLKLQNFQLHINNGSLAGQDVFHFHVHILSDE